MKDSMDRRFLKALYQGMTLVVPKIAQNMNGL
jgi:hypothetical protein